MLKKNQKCFSPLESKQRGVEGYKDNKRRLRKEKKQKEETRGQTSPLEAMKAKKYSEPRR